MGLKEESKKNYSTRNSVASCEELQIGCLQRIADAVEAIVPRYQSLIDDAQYARKDAACVRAINQKLERRLAAMRGVVTKLKAGRHPRGGQRRATR